MAKFVGADTGGIGGLTGTFKFSDAMGTTDAQRVPIIVRQVTSSIVEQLVPGLKDMAQANEELIDTFMRLANARRSADIDKIFGRMSGVLGARNDLADLFLSDLSPLTASQRLARSQGDYASLLAGAERGDLASISGLSGGARSYLQEARSYYASSPAYTSIFNDVQSAVNDLVSDTLVEQTRQLSDMNLSLGEIADYTAKLPDLPQEIAAALQPALDALRIAQEATIAAQQQAAETIAQSNVDAAREQQFVAESAASARFGQDG
jgi:hypothetical protein